MSGYSIGKKKITIAWVLAAAVLSLLIMLACSGDDSTPKTAVELSPTIAESPPESTQESTDASAPSGDTDLYRAVWAGTIDEVRSMVAKGADVDARDDSGDPILYTAIWRADPEKVQILVDAGADVNAKDSSGEPMLYTAIWRDKIEALKILVESWCRRECSGFGR